MAILPLPALGEMRQQTLRYLAKRAPVSETKR